MRTHWSNWSGLVQCDPKDYATPSSVEEVAQVVQDAAHDGRNIRVVGSGHSFSDLVKTDDLLMSLDNLQGVVSASAEDGEAELYAGTKLLRMNQLLDEYGVALENLGDINVQSVAGVVSTGSHGTGIKFGNISSQALGATLVAANGEIVECSETENRDHFKAAQVSIGALGVLVKLRVRALPSYRIEYVRKASTIEETFANADRYKDETRNFEFFFFPYGEGVLQKFLNTTDDPISGDGPMKWFTDVVMENAAFEAMSRVARAFPSTCPRIARIAGGSFSSSRQVNVSHKCFSTVRSVRFNEMEYAVPVESGLDAAREIKEWVEKKRLAVHFPIEFRYVQGDDIFISPHYGRDSVAISVHMYKGMPHEEYFKGCEAIFRNYDGRPHWGKLHSLGAKELAPLYPKWDAFQSIRRELDPKGVFMTPYLKRLFED